MRALGPLCAFPAIIPNSDTPMNTISRLEGEAEGKAAEHGALLAVNTTISMEGESIKGNHFEEREGTDLSGLKVPFTTGMIRGNFFASWQGCVKTTNKDLVS